MATTKIRHFKSPKRKGFITPINKRICLSVVKDGLFAFSLSLPICYYLFPLWLGLMLYISLFATAAVMFSSALHWKWRRFWLTNCLIIKKKQMLELKQKKAGG